MPHFTIREREGILEWVEPLLDKRYVYPLPKTARAAFEILGSILVHNPEVTRSEIEHVFFVLRGLVADKP